MRGGVAVRLQLRQCSDHIEEVGQASGQLGEVVAQVALGDQQWMPPRRVSSKRWHGDRDQPTRSDRLQQLRRPPQLVARQHGGLGHPHLQPPEQPSSPGETHAIPRRVIDVDILQDEQQPLVAEVDDAVHHRQAQTRRQPVPTVGEVQVHLLTPPPTTQREQGVR